MLFRAGRNVANINKQNTKNPNGHTWKPTGDPARINDFPPASGCFSSNFGALTVLSIGRMVAFSISYMHQLSTSSKAPYAKQSLRRRTGKCSQTSCTVVKSSSDTIAVTLDPISFTMHRERRSMTCERNTRSTSRTCVKPRFVLGDISPYSKQEF